jgi:helix-turn-helix protein
MARPHVPGLIARGEPRTQNKRDGHRSPAASASGLDGRGPRARDTDEKMDDVAHQAGYSGAANLSRAFKKAMGVRPGEFRRASA